MSDVLICAKRGKAEAKKAAKELTQWLKGRKLKVTDVTDTDDKLTESFLKKFKLGVVLGGDGTFLTLIRRLERKDIFPFIGINLGTLGFITEINSSEMIQAVEDALEGRCIEEPRRLLEVEVWREGKRIEAGTVFNDAALSRDARTSMMKLDVYVGDEYLSYARADGYLVSTPTGSTAYALSAGGPLLHPDVPGMLLVPICSHSLSVRPVIIPASHQVQITAKEFRGDAYLVYDGQISFEIKVGDVIKVYSSHRMLRLIRAPQKKWSQTIRTKLGMT